jgi:hypothetical protein
MRIGDHLNHRAIHGVKGVAKYLEVGYLMKQMEYPLREIPKWTDTREQLSNDVAQEIGSKRVLYLEFGVYRGDATRYWSPLLKNPESMLHGFDSFEGLPENWIEVKTVMR